MIHLRIILPQRTAAWLLMLACIVLGVGCASPIRKTYDGIERPMSEIDIVRSSSRFSFWSFTDIYTVDGLRIWPSSAIAVLPGAHWYQVVVTRRSVGAIFLLRDGFYQEAICGFMFDAVPGAVHTLGTVESNGLLSTDEHKVYKASLELEERFADSTPITRHIPIECASLDMIKGGRLKLVHKFPKGFLCRVSQDCHEEGAICIREDGYSYGICDRP